MGWKAIADSLSGVATVQHAVLTVGGTFEVAPGTQYPSNVVSGLAQFINPDLCFEVPIDYPASFGPLSGATADSYNQSIAVAEANIAAWLAANPTQTFALGGYSQGGEAVSRVAIQLMGGTLEQYLPNFIGGYTFGNPCRMAGAVAPGIGNPGPDWRGISSLNMTELPTINGQVVWADYIHSTANGDPANDMYGMVPVSDVGTIMTDVYTAATETQLNDITTFTSQIVSALEQLVSDSGILGGLDGLRGRGTLAVGNQADIVVFDPAEIGGGTVQPRTDLPAGGMRLYSEPSGIRSVIVNGVPVVDKYKYSNRFIVVQRNGLPMKNK